MYSRVYDAIAAANRLLSTKDSRDLRYAALEARMAIEGLFYALLPHYRDELPDDIVKRWQPRQLIDAITACNPFVQMHQQVTIGPVAGDVDGPKFVGSYKPVSRDLLRKYYHRLGAYLHAAMDGAVLNEPKLRATVIGALQRVEEHCNDTTVIINFGPYITVLCGCGREIKRNIFALTSRHDIRCPDPDCGAIYDLIALAPVMQSAWTLRSEPFKCGQCSHESQIGIHRLKAGAEIVCEGCNAKFVLRPFLIPNLVSPLPSASAEPQSA